MWLIVSCETLVYQKLFKYNYQEYLSSNIAVETLCTKYDTSGENTHEENTYIHVCSSTLYSPCKCFFLEVRSQGELSLVTLNTVPSLCFFSGEASFSGRSVDCTSCSEGISCKLYKKWSYLGYNYHCRSAMICRDDLELRWRLLMLKMGFRTYLCYYTFILHFNYL